MHPASVGFLNLHDHKLRRAKKRAILTKCNVGEYEYESSFSNSDNISVFQILFADDAAPDTASRTMTNLRQNNNVF